MSQVFRLDRRAVGKISLLTAVFYFSAYFYRFFTLGYAHDSLLIDQSIDMTWQIQLGRFLQPVYLLFRGDIAVPYLIGLLAYLYLAAAICLVVDLLSLSSTLSISLVCMALCANTTLTRLHGTFHMMADSYMLALLLSVLCVFVAVRLRHGVWLAPVLLCGSAALYQSYVPVATVFFLILLVHHALDGFSFHALLLRGVRYLGVLIAGLVFYSLCLRVVYALTGQTAADSYNGMAGMGNFEGYSIVDLLRRAYLFPFEKMARPQTAFPPRRSRGLWPSPALFAGRRLLSASCPPHRPALCRADLCFSAARSLRRRFHLPALQRHGSRPDDLRFFLLRRAAHLSG